MKALVARALLTLLLGVGAVVVVVMEVVALTTLVVLVGHMVVEAEIIEV